MNALLDWISPNSYILQCKQWRFDIVSGLDELLNQRALHNNDLITMQPVLTEYMRYLITLISQSFPFYGQYQERSFSCSPVAWGYQNWSQATG